MVAGSDAGKAKSPTPPNSDTNHAISLSRCARSASPCLNERGLQFHTDVSHAQTATNSKRQNSLSFAEVYTEASRARSTASSGRQISVGGNALSCPDEVMDRGLSVSGTACSAQSRVDSLRGKSGDPLDHGPHRALQFCNKSRPASPTSSTYPRAASDTDRTYSPSPAEKSLDYLIGCSKSSISDSTCGKADHRMISFHDTKCSAAPSKLGLEAAFSFTERFHAIPLSEQEADRNIIDRETSCQSPPSKHRLGAATSFAENEESLDLSRVSIVDTANGLEGTHHVSVQRFAHTSETIFGHPAAQGQVTVERDTLGTNECSTVSFTPTVQQLQSVEQERVRADSKSVAHRSPAYCEEVDSRPASRRAHEDSTIMSTFSSPPSRVSDAVNPRTPAAVGGSGASLGGHGSCESKADTCERAVPPDVGSGALRLRKVGYEDGINSEMLGQGRKCFACKDGLDDVCGQMSASHASAECSSAMASIGCGDVLNDHSAEVMAIDHDQGCVSAMAGMGGWSELDVSTGSVLSSCSEAKGQRRKRRIDKMDERTRRLARILQMGV